MSTDITRETVQEFLDGYHVEPWTDDVFRWDADRKRARDAEQERDDIFAELKVITAEREAALIRAGQAEAKLAAAWDEGARAEQNRPRLAAYPPNPYRA